MSRIYQLQKPNELFDEIQEMSSINQSQTIESHIIELTELRKD